MSKGYLILLTIAITFVVFFKIYEEKQSTPADPPVLTTVTHTSPEVATLPPPPLSKTIQNDYHVFQTFNNCGPAALSMTLSYYGFNHSQFELGQDLRPYQNPLGDNDDKSVTLDELAKKAAEYGLVPFHRPNGSIELVKQFIANDIPVVTRTLLTETEDIGHYRVIKGYNDATGEIVQDDSLQGHNLKYTYSEFTKLWQTFNYEYLVLVPRKKEFVARAILGEDTDVVTSWKKAAANSRRELELNPDDMYARFNLSVALYYTGDFQNSVLNFEMIENRLPFRTLWYQIEPVQAYFELGDYQRVFSLTEEIFNNQNRAFSELYTLRGKVFKKQGNLEAAESEFEKAYFYNKSQKPAYELLI